VLPGDQYSFPDYFHDKYVISPKKTKKTVLSEVTISLHPKTKSFPKLISIYSHHNKELLLATHAPSIDEYSYSLNLNQDYNFDQHIYIEMEKEEYEQIIIKKIMFHEHNFSVALDHESNEVREVKVEEEGEVEEKENILDGEKGRTEVAQIGKIALYRKNKKLN
jgi:hypothetical protein